MALAGIAVGFAGISPGRDSLLADARAALQSFQPAPFGEVAGASTEQVTVCGFPSGTCQPVPVSRTAEGAVGSLDFSAGGVVRLADCFDLEGAGRICADGRGRQWLVALP